MKAGVLAVGAMMLVTQLAEAQGSPRMGSMDLTIGPGLGHGGANPGLHAAVAVDGHATWRARAVSGGSFLLGLSATLQGSLDNSDDCELAPGGGCVPRFPDTYAIGLLAGVERGDPGGASVRLLGGIARYADADDWHPAFGIQGRVDLATATWHGFALVTSVRAAVIPRLRGDAYQFGALGFGLRLQ